MRDSVAAAKAVGCESSAQHLRIFHISRTVVFEEGGPEFHFQVESCCCY